MNTARVSLRDKHIEVLLEADMLGFLARASTLDISHAKDSDLGVLYARAKEILEGETRLEADGTPLGLELRAFPTPEELRTLAQKQSTMPHAHGELVSLRLEAPQALGTVEELSIVFPQSLGPVLISFVQPTTRWTGPGAKAAFSVLEAPTASRAANSNTLGLAALGLALLALFANIAQRWRKQGEASPKN